MRDLLLELNTKLTNEKVKISPIGIAKGLDGRVFKIDGEKLINNIQKNGLDIALNLNHQGGEAYGWFDRNSLELREDGIYASLELTPKGKELVENKAFRYLSPEYYVDDDKNVIHLDAMGLVNQPNLLNRALNKARSLINSTKNSKLSTPRSGTEAKKGKVEHGLQVGAGSEAPTRKDDFSSSAKLKKERNTMNEEELEELQKLAEQVEEQAENVEESVQETEDCVGEGENPDSELETLRQENEELKAQIAELKAKLETALNKNEETEIELNKKRLDSLLQNGLILPNRYQKALNMKGRVLEDYLDVCKKEANIVLGKKELNFTNKRKELNAYEAKVFKQLGIKGGK
ncbi:hypothetical protein O0P73_000604 [Campylobacter jejuni]|uniref:Mu-like prophage I protein n=1 Tax=Campylobacter jejuni TaxID=197 RepID=A0A6V8G6W4_CAMJU|nr:hypothetical protein [Campylobacter jejuni]EHD1236397.1 hypothetical protein [Campylobacter jejuni]EKF7548746.1 hypothetical protein [Campylobacter jejuni]ELL3625924.1 hypothetical protein [Campylobacter jejuni]